MFYGTQPAEHHGDHYTCEHVDCGRTFPKGATSHKSQHLKHHVKCKSRCALCDNKRPAEETLSECAVSEELLTIPSNTTTSIQEAIYSQPSNTTGGSSTAGTWGGGRNVW